MTPLQNSAPSSEKQSLAEQIKRHPHRYLEILKKYRKTEEHHLKVLHYAKTSGREIAHLRAQIVDTLFHEIFKIKSAEIHPAPPLEKMVVMAFGGYGRRELNPYSDVDIMFIHAENPLSPSLAELIRQCLTTLWDLGFKVGHSTRSISQAIAQANTDMVIKTSMLEARYLVGDQKLYRTFKRRFARSCVKGHVREYVAWRLENRDALRMKYGNSVYMQEPHVKCGRGGMRDYQSMLWIAYFKEQVASLSKLVELEFLRKSEQRALDKAYDFLMRVRTEMHYRYKRPIDQLTLQMQGRVATALHYPQKNILERSEAFMRDYYRSVRDIDRLTAMVMEHLQRDCEKRPRGVLKLLHPSREAEESFDGFQCREGFLAPRRKDIFLKDPNRLMRAFHHAQIRGLNLSYDLRDLIRQHLHLVGKSFRGLAVNRDTFLTILSRKGEVGRILRLMHETGFLGKFLPEFGALDCLVQHEFYHRYTADEHTLVCLEKLDGILFTEEPRLTAYRDLFQKLEDPTILHLALLLHDTGRVANHGRHEEQSVLLARKVAKRLSLSSQQQKQLLVLVQNHCELSNTARKRNLEDPSTIAEFASSIGDKETLEALMLLTLADGMGTSDQDWSDWKEALVWQLFIQSGNYLEGSERFLLAQTQRREQLIAQIQRELGSPFHKEIAAHFKSMPDRYFLAFQAPDIRDHLKLFHSFFERHLKDASGLVPVVKWVAKPEKGHSEVWVCGWNRPRLLERLTGAFLSAQINILSADIFTRNDDLALDIFRVCNTQYRPVTDAKDIGAVEKQIHHAFAHTDFDFSPLLHEPSRHSSYRLSQEVKLPTQVLIENKSHPVYTLVEIQAPDRLGLLYDLLRALNNCGAHIELSRITTERGVAIDTFYIIQQDGKKFTDPQAIENLQKTLQRAGTHPPINKSLSNATSFRAPQ